MREIKFRAWNPVLKRMTYSEDLTSIGLQFSGHLHSFAVLNMVKGKDVDEILVQYTGLKDKNGKEIYEGDNYQWKGFEVKDGKQIRPIRKGIIVWAYPELARIQNIIEGTGTLEIIGNIYENPGLLK